MRRATNSTRNRTTLLASEGLCRTVRTTFLRLLATINDIRCYRANETPLRPTTTPRRVDICRADGYPFTVKQRPLLYLETSIFGFYFDEEPRNAIRRDGVREFFRQLELGMLNAVVSR